MFHEIQDGDFWKVYGFRWKAVPSDGWGSLFPGNEVQFEGKQDGDSIHSWKLVVRGLDREEYCLSRTFRDEMAARKCLGGIPEPVTVEWLKKRGFHESVRDSWFNRLAF